MKKGVSFDGGVALLTKRWIATLLLVLVPLQMSFAAVHEYVEHQPDASGAVSILHTHHSASGDHASHASADLADHDADHASSVGDAPDEGFGHIHLGYAHPVSTPFVGFAGESAASVTNEPTSSSSISPRRLDRPPLRARL